MSVLTLTDATFDEVVAGSDLPVLVEFWATWCGPCTMLAPILEQLADERRGQLVVAKLDIDDNLATSRNHEVMAAPTMLLFIDGQERRRIIGARGKGQLLQELSEYLSSPSAVRSG
jgi:thioredoxin 1